MIGNLFENMIICNIKKNINISGSWDKLYFYRDSNQNEIDLIIDTANKQIPIEIKSSSTFSKKFLDWINYRQNLNKGNSKKEIEKWIIIYTWDNIYNNDVGIKLFRSSLRFFISTSLL